MPKTLKGYAVVTRDCNSWSRTTDGDCYGVTFDCGHKHRTIAGAIRCMSRFNNSTLSIGMGIETYAYDQQFEGVRLSEDDIEKVLYRS